MSQPHAFRRSVGATIAILTLACLTPQAQSQITIDFTQFNPLVDGTTDPADFYQTAETVSPNTPWTFTFNIDADESGNFTFTQSENEVTVLPGGSPSQGLLPDSAVAPGISGSASAGFGYSFTIGMWAIGNGGAGDIGVNDNEWELRVDGQDDGSGDGLGIQGLGANTIDSRADDFQPERLVILSDNTGFVGKQIVFQEITLNHSGGSDTIPRVWDIDSTPFADTPDPATITEAANAPSIDLTGSTGFTIDAGISEAILLDGGDVPATGEPNRAFRVTSITFDIVDLGSVNELFGDINDDGAVDAGDITAFAAGWKTDTSAFANNFLRHEVGDLNYDGITDFGDWSILRGLLTASGVSAPASPFGAAPEPTSLALAGLATLALAGFRGRRC